MRRSFKIAAALTLVLVIVVVGAVELLLIPLTLAFGWIKSAIRFASALQLSSATIVWSLIIVAVLIGGTHVFCESVRRASNSAAPWRWRWTCGFYGALGLVLFASAALVGIAHQTGWMISSDEPIFRRRGPNLRERMRLSNVGHQALQAAHDSNWDLVRVKQELIGPRPGSNWEDFAFYFVGGSNGTVDRVIVLPRNPKNQTDIGVVERGTFQTRRLRDLAELLVQSPP